MQRLISFLLASFAISTAFADDAPLVTVTGGLPVVDEANPETQTSFSKVITRDQFRTQTGSVADVLKQETGVQLRQYGGLGSTSNIYLRGSDAQQVNVYLDGLLVNAAAGGGVDLSQFLLGAIESIEVYPDVTPIQLGFPNLAGAVNIKTLKPEKGMQRAYIGAGSFSAKNAGVVLNEASGAHSGLLATEYLAAENDFDILNDQNTQNFEGDDFVEPRHNADFDQINALLKYEYAFDKLSGLQTLLVHNNKDKGLPDLQNSVDSRSSLQTESTQLQTRYFRGFENNRSSSVRAYYAATVERYDDRQAATGLDQDWSNSTTRAYGVNPSMAWIHDTHLITTSLEARRETYDETNLLRDSASPEWVRDGLSLGLQDEWQNEMGSWLVVPAISAQWLQDEGNLIVDRSLTQFDRSEGYYTARLGVRHLIDEQWSLKSNVARNVRAPSLFELMGDRGFFVGQPDLEAEKSIATDIGIAYERTTIKGSIVAFHRDINDALVVVYNSQGVGGYQNISQAEITGAELSFNYTLPMNALMLLRTTLQDPRDKSNLSDRAGDVLPSVYRHASNITLMHCYSRFENRLEYSIEEGGYYSPGEVTAIPDKKLLNYYVAYLQNGFQISLEAKNILDDKYEDFYLFPAPGRNYFLKVSQEF